ncbi:uncharacterized protein LOC119771258 isoform X2 [Culex quinquefasciatus]|uniref:uncharacterized protein LOC119771258 isoform X2 n=1 Tax=Culex quinquefasciatus TaxID=7176 RepID=UPI0018E29844|nr:uncharacterized protein LOC119771258 isoform X2 [Culex quinquefasciatus]
MVERVEQAVKFFHSRCVFDPVLFGRSFKSFNRNEIACACEKPNSRRQICRVTDPGGRRRLVSATFGSSIVNESEELRDVNIRRFMKFGDGGTPPAAAADVCHGICNGAELFDYGTRKLDQRNEEFKTNQSGVSSRQKVPADRLNTPRHHPPEGEQEPVSIEGFKRNRKRKKTSWKDSFWRFAKS